MLFDSTKPLAENVTGTVVSLSGHWIPERRAARFVIEMADDIYRLSRIVVRKN
jgi:hypothetical protein